ncbi:protoheme IX farnesyltransferase [Pueribacillus theae]|uniref:Protoheme IX farnesyltransferase n=1 Tax=Pueribacillus theae TaxID=2171751 RepID=A0A2U1K7R9_9BACI|nr:heme o synthase [Pueribacillus theae]PWA13581.1 protoheme IX farnesyltransferase [Pueribacillus theae]
MEPGPLSEPKTGTWKDFITLTKTGIVTSNFMTAFLGVWLAAKFTGFSLTENFLHVFLALLGTTLVIAGGTSLNNYIDRDIDEMMPRTQDRPSVDGRIPPNQVLWVGFSLSVIGIVLLLMTNVISAVFGLIGLLFYVVLYSMWTKRTTSFNTAVGAVSGAMPPVIGWAAIDPQLHPVALILFLILFFWQMPHFFAISMMRCEDYRAAGIPMLPVVAGFEATKRQMVLYVTALIPVSLLLFKLGVVYTAFMAALGLGWFAVGLAGFKMKDELKWAKIMFVYSLNYLTIMVIVTILVTFKM